MNQGNPLSELLRDKGPVRPEKVEELLNMPSTHDFMVRGVIKDLTDAEVDECLRREPRMSVLRILNSERNIRKRHPKTVIPQRKSLSEQVLSDAEYKEAVRGTIFE